MKISQLILREEFYNILIRTIRNNTYFNFKNKELTLIQFNSYKYLNILMPREYKLKNISELINDYRFSVSKLKSIIQGIYVAFAFKSALSFLFVDKRVNLPIGLKGYAILGGNHRIRLFDEKMSSSVVLLKSGENRKFISNEVQCKKSINISYCPKIISSGEDWLKEEFVSGIALNRVSDNNLIKRNKEKILEIHYNQLINKTKELLPVKVYIGIVIEEIKSLKYNDKNQNAIKSVITYLNQIMVQYKNKKLYVCISHGDFQIGNMRMVNEEQIKVLDWEATARRYYLYDAFVILSDIRQGLSIDESIRTFFSFMNSYDYLNIVDDKETIAQLLYIEELVFNLFEEVSNNYCVVNGKAKALLIRQSMN